MVKSLFKFMSFLLSVMALIGSIFVFNMNYFTKMNVEKTATVIHKGINVLPNDMALNNVELEHYVIYQLEQPLRHVVKKVVVPLDDWRKIQVFSTSSIMVNELELETDPVNKYFEFTLYFLINAAFMFFACFLVNWYTKEDDAHVEQISKV